MSEKCYPSKILPHATYRHRIGIERLLAKFPNLMVVRMVAGTPQDYSDEIDGENILLPSVFSGNMANLSMNLAGGLFDTASDAHLGFLPKSKEATSPWDYAAHTLDMLKGEGGFEHKEPCFGLCFRVEDIHWKTFPYLRHFDSEQKRDDYAKQVTSTHASELMKDKNIVGDFMPKEKTAEVHLGVKIHHAPTNANYWHVTLDTYRPTDADYIRYGEKQSSPDKRMFEQLKQHLLVKLVIDDSPGYRLKRLDYIRKYRCTDALFDLLDV